MKFKKGIRVDHESHISITHLTCSGNVFLISERFAQWFQDSLVASNDLVAQKGHFFIIIPDDNGF